ncbi:MAG: V-type ATP synthase subunit A, partial [Candidatus Cloacimonadota bacterium]
MTKGIVKGIIANLVLIEVDGPVSQNEICYINLSGVKLMAEVIKVVGAIAYAQVFESTRGMQPGNEVEFVQHMLQVKLGPGMLSRNYDGLQNDLNKMHGVFLTRGEYTDPLDEDSRWDFEALAKTGDQVTGGDWLGQVKESWINHKIMVPFAMDEIYTVKSGLPGCAQTVTRGE